MGDTDANAIETAPGLDDLPALIARAQQGDATVLPALRRALDDNPALWRRCGDLAAVAQQAWVELAAGANLLARESLTRTLRALEAEVAGPAPSRLERLLAARVAACWLQLHYADALAAPREGAPVPQAKLALERQAKASRAYIQAIGALAAVRRLLPPLEAGPRAGLPAREHPVVDADEGLPGAGRVERGHPAASSVEVAIDTVAAGPCGLVLPIGPAATGAAPEEVGRVAGAPGGRVRDCAGKGGGSVMRTPRRRRIRIKQPAMRIDRATSRLIGLVASPDAAVRAAAVTALGRLGTAAVAPLCYRLLKSRDVAFRRAALRALGTVGAADWPTALATLGGLPESHRDPETVAVMRETFVRVLITVREGRPATEAEVEAMLRGAAEAARSTS